MSEKKTEAELLKEKLCYDPKNAYKEMSDEEISKSYAMLLRQNVKLLAL